LTPIGLYTPRSQIWNGHCTVYTPRGCILINAVSSYDGNRGSGKKDPLSLLGLRLFILMPIAGLIISLIRS